MRVEDWDISDVKAFLEALIPGHPCIFAFRHTTGSILASMSKDDMMRLVRDPGALDTLWTELQSFKDWEEHHEGIRNSGDAPQKLFIRTPAEVMVELEVRLSETVFQLKQRVERVEGTPVDAQRLTLHGGPLADNRTLASYKLSPNTVLLLVPKISVGGHRYVPPHGAGSYTRGLGALSSASGPHNSRGLADGATSRSLGAAGLSPSSSAFPSYSSPRGLAANASSSIASPFAGHGQYRGYNHNHHIIDGASTSAGAAAAASSFLARTGADGGTPSTGHPRPRVPVACADITRPFPMYIEFEGIPEYQRFMLGLQRAAGRKDSSRDDSENAPFLEVIQVDNLHDRVQTRIFFDSDAEILLIDSMGDILMECARYRVMLHLRSAQEHALLVTGIRAER